MELTSAQLKSLEKLFESEPLVKLAYFFGSRATSTAGPLSDYDFAVYADTKDKHESFNLQCRLNGRICGILNTDAVDVVMLESTTRPLIKYQAISEGILLYDREPFRVRVEAREL